MTAASTAPPMTRRDDCVTAAATASVTAALTEPAAPTLIQFGKVSRRSSVYDRRLSMTPNHGHPKVQLDPVIPMTHPVNFRAHDVALAHL